MRNTPFTFLVAAACLAIVEPSWAGKFNKKLSVGDPAPAFAKLPGVDDAPHALADYADAKVVVVVFTCNHCPVAQAYEGRIIDLAREFAPRGVRFVAISVSQLASDKLPGMKARAAEKEYPFDYLYDETQRSGEDYGATNTPHVFVLDAARVVRYMGAIDNDAVGRDAARTNYLRDALEAVLADKPMEVVETRPAGCPILYE